jgi:hypothetical protein
LKDTRRSPNVEKNSKANRKPQRVVCRGITDLNNIIGIEIFVLKFRIELDDFSFTRDRLQEEKY